MRIACQRRIPVSFLIIMTQELLMTTATTLIITLISCILCYAIYLMSSGPKASTSAEPKSSPDTESTPTIIVNMPQDARPLEQLTNPDGGEPTIIGSDRAVLWWTVYKHTLDDEVYNISMDGCLRAANEAVLAVYGPPKP